MDLVKDPRQVVWVVDFVVGLLPFGVLIDEPN